MNLNDHRDLFLAAAAPREMRSELNWDEKSAETILRCILIATVILGYVHCISSWREVKFQRTIKSGSCNFFLSFTIIIAFLSVIESLKPQPDWRREEMKFFLGSKEVSARLLMNSQSMYCHRSESDKICYNRWGKNFFRNKSTTRFVNSRFEVFFDVSQKSHFNLNSWFPPLFLLRCLTFLSF